MMDFLRLHVFNHDDFCMRCGKQRKDCTSVRCGEEGNRKRDKKDTRPPWALIPTPIKEERQHIPAEPSTDCGGICAAVIETVSKLTESVRNMIPDANSGNNNQQQRKSSGFQYLKVPDDFSSNPEVAEILACRVDNQGKYGPKVVLKVAYKGETRLLSMTIKGNPNVAYLSEQFGREENSWVGKSITLFLERDDFTGNYRLRAGLPERKSARK